MDLDWLPLEQDYCISFQDEPGALTKEECEIFFNNGDKLTDAEYREIVPVAVTPICRGCGCQSIYCGKCGPLITGGFTRDSTKYWPYWVGAVKPPKPDVALPEDLLKPIKDRFVEHATDRANKLYELTITINPQVHPGKDPVEMLHMFEKIIKSDMTNVIDWAYVFELQENGYPHIHAALVCKKNKVEVGKVLKRYCGAHRCSMSILRSIPAWITYMHKQIREPAHVAWATEYGVSTFAIKQIE